MGDLIDVSGLGKLSIAKDAKVPLLVVFGGKTVGRPSGVYMWDFMNAVQDRFHIFVAVNHHVNGKKAYDALLSTLQTQSLNPSQQILYLFWWLRTRHGPAGQPDEQQESRPVFADLPGRHLDGHRPAIWLRVSRLLPGLGK